MDINELGYTFKNEEILSRALTHSSYINENNLKHSNCYERLEFLGDSILGMVVAEYLFKKHKDKKEGELSKIRASIVNESSLALLARSLNLGEKIRLGKGEIKSEGYNKDSLLADTMESVIGAIYLDAGFAEVKSLIKEKIIPFIEENCDRFIDYKSTLQEYLQSNRQTAHYNHVREEGPDNDKIFYVEVTGEDKVAMGKGKNKKSAEQDAAKNLLELLGVECQN